MAGFMGVINTREFPTDSYSNDFFENNVCFNEFFIDKFRKEKIFQQDDRYIIIFDGLILNLEDLLKKFQCLTLAELITSMYTKLGEDFFGEFRGNFCGCLCDMEHPKVILFTDHLGNSPLYYYKDSAQIIISTEIKRITDMVERQGKKITLNLGGAYSLLTYAYMYNDNTLFNDIHRITPGHYLRISSNKIDDIEYFKICNSKINNISEQEALEKIDCLFLQAVKLQADKNREYGYCNYAPLSAGLDSRVVSYALKRLEEDIINFTYAESERLDHVVPMKIARELKNKWLFKSLDNGLDLLNIDEAISLSDSRIYYPWSSQLSDFMKLFNPPNLGLIHTGVLGDVVIGTFYHKWSEYKDGINYKIGDGAYSTKLVPQLIEHITQKHYENYEMGMYYNRGLNGACLGYSSVFQQYTEAHSPFMNLEFLQFCLSLPMEFRYQHKIYYKWVKSYYPNACKYGHNGLKIHSTNLNFNVNGKKIYLDTIPSRIKQMIDGRDRANMNPFQWWYDNNLQLKQCMDEYFEKKVRSLALYPCLYNDVVSLYHCGNAIEKTMCISLVGSVSMFLTP